MYFKVKIARELDVSDSYWKQFDMHNLKAKKEMGLYETESVGNPNICTIAINPKEYFEKFRDTTINKKHKGIRRDAPGMNFKSYASRIHLGQSMAKRRGRKNSSKKITGKKYKHGND